MTTMADRDSGQQRRANITSQVVDLTLWWLDGPDSQPPDSIAHLPAEQRRALWGQVAALATQQGDGFVHALSALAQRPNQAT